MSFKIREEHINMFADFMESNVEFARGRLSCASAREEFKKIWAELSNNLNSIGYGVRTVEKWQRTWSDYKLNLKKRASELKKDLTQTGGGPPVAKKLCDTDCRILNILGKSFYQGCGVKEQGFTNVSNTQANTSSTSTTTVVSANPKTISSLPSTSSSTSASDNELKRKLNFDDHDYLASERFPKKVRKRREQNENQSMNTYYEETILLLKSIDKNTKNINVTLGDINSTLDTRFLELCEILKNK